VPVKASRALRQLRRINASAIRDGEVREIDAEQLVPGDVVLLESGDRVPADLRLLSAHGLEFGRIAAHRRVGRRREERAMGRRGLTPTIRPLTPRTKDGMSTSAGFYRAPTAS
jgi:hypothetical protein